MNAVTKEPLPTPGDDTDTAGAILATARIDQGLDVADLSGRLRLAPRQIEALENDQYDRLAGPTFIRGIIRGYAKALQIDPQPALAAYERTAPQVPGLLAANVPTHAIRFASGAAAEGGKRVKAGLLVLALAVIGGGVWVWYTAPGTDAKRAAPAVKSVRETAQQAPAPVQEASPQMAPPVAAVSVTEPPAAPATGSPAGGDAAGAERGADASFSAAPAAAIPETAPATAEATASTRQPTLRLTFRDESWVQVKDSTGKVLTAKLNPAGSEQTLTGKPPFALIVGNAGAVRLTYNGRRVDLAPHVEDNVARLRVQ